MNTTRKLCDICGEYIHNFETLADNAMIESFHTYQSWPVGEKVYDVCKLCCNKIEVMNRLGIVHIDMDGLFIRAGFVKDGELWRYEEEMDEEKIGALEE